MRLTGAPQPTGPIAARLASRPPPERRRQSGRNWPDVRPAELSRCVREKTDARQPRGIHTAISNLQAGPLCQQILWAYFFLRSPFGLDNYLLIPVNGPHSLNSGAECYSTVGSRREKVKSRLGAVFTPEQAPRRRGYEVLENKVSTEVDPGGALDLYPQT